MANSNSAAAASSSPRAELAHPHAVQDVRGARLELERVRVGVGRLFPALVQLEHVAQVGPALEERGAQPERAAVARHRLVGAAERGQADALHERELRILRVGGDRLVDARQHLLVALLEHCREGEDVEGLGIARLALEHLARERLALQELPAVHQVGGFAKLGGDGGGGQLGVSELRECTRTP